MNLTAEAITPAAPASAKHLIPIIAASSVGTLIEWYDFFIFGSLATIISTQFFPKDNPAAALLSTLATFGAGYIARPFGALVFGRLGDMVGRKYTFMITLVLMGGATFAIGLVPTYESIGFFAPLIVLILRLLQGLAIGGEYGGAATYVAEHAPADRRGFWTSWIQMASPAGLLLSMSVIITTKNWMSKTAWEEWGWRIPFLVSIAMVYVSVQIRKNMSESPLFAKAKAEGKTSVNPLKESFGNKANLKVVLLALFGLTMGQGVLSTVSQIYLQTFMLKTMNLEYEQQFILFMSAILLALAFYPFFGWLSDRVGRKPLLMTSLLLAILCVRPIFEKMYQSTNLNNKTAVAAFAAIETRREKTAHSSLDSLVTTTKRQTFTDGTISEEIQKQVLSPSGVRKTEIIRSVKITGTAYWTVLTMVFLLLLIVILGYAPIAAFLVEMFPLKIRYSSLSLPYHLGFGVFGGMTPVVGAYLIGKANDAHTGNYYLAGLNYFMLTGAVSLAIGLLYLRENKEGSPTPFLLSRLNVIELIKKVMGLVWILLGLAAAYFGVFELGIPKITSGKLEDMVFGAIVLIVLTPITTGGLLIFGKYALEGEYSE